MIVVLDTNVIVSSLLSSKSAPAEIIRRWEAEEFEIVTSLPLLRELRRALTYEQVTRYLKQSQEQTDAFIKRLGVVATLAEPTETIDAVSDDPGDNQVVECAVAGGASFIVTGDTHLLNLGNYQGIAILRPRDFLSVLELERGDR